ncbi:MAG: hypothetical protein J5634_02360 [Bacilli bacterium]|nr:hypothetical protein [Bacilli bacterium]
MDNNLPENNEPKVEEISSKNKTKKGNVAIKATIITLIVAALAVGGFFAYKMFLSKDPVKLTSKAIRGLKDGISDVKEDNSAVAKILEGDDAFEVKSNIKIDLPKELGSDYVIKLLAQADTEGQEVKFDIVAKEDGKTIIDLSALVDAAKVYFKLDGMNNYYYTKLEETISSFDIEELPTLPDYDYENIIEYLADAVDSVLSNKDFSKDKDELTIGSKDVKVTRYTAEIDEVKLKAIADKFLDKVSSDKKLMSVLAELTEESEADIKDAIKEFKKAKASDLGEISFDYSVFVTSSGDVIGYSFGAEGVEVLFADYKDVFSIQLLAQGMRGSLEFEKKSDDHYVATLDVMGMITGELDLKTGFKEVEKNEEYNYTLDANLKVNVSGQDPIKGSLNVDTTIKKIDKVDTSAKIGAKSLDDLTTAEENELYYQLQKSNTYKFLEGLMSGGSSYIEDYSTSTYSLN